jgi:hypothetical protein
MDPKGGLVQANLEKKRLGPYLAGKYERSTYKMAGSLWNIV